MARAVIEATAKEKGITTGQIGSKIAELEKRGFVRPHVREVADEIRHFGNGMAHGDFADATTEDEASQTLVLMGEVLAEVFESPARIGRVKAARAAKKDAGQSGATTT